MAIPSPAQYPVKPITPWGGINSRNNSDNLFTRDKRDVIAQEIENLNKKKDRTTPSPGHYSPNYKHVEPSNSGPTALNM